jgi:hypothetical protein
MKKIIILILFVCTNFSISAQEKSILKILNQGLKKELQNQLQSENFYGDTLTFVQDFEIDKNKILHFQIKKTSANFSGYQLIKQEVALKDIIELRIDIRLFLETEENAVTTHYTYSNKEIEPETTTGSFFRLYFQNEKQTEKLGLDLQKAFIKAGYTIDKQVWYRE